MSQLRADIWCAAFVRRHNDRGHLCVVARRGDPIAGQVWIELDYLNGTVSLFGPAPTLLYSETDRLTDRLFQPVLERVEPAQCAKRLESEARFDPDFWHVLLELREGEDAGLTLVSSPGSI